MSGSNRLIHFLYPEGLSHGVCAAAAKDFDDRSTVLEGTDTEPGFTDYEITGNTTSVRSRDDTGNIELTTGMPTADFIGGVAYALFQRGTISASSASPSNVARVCLEVGKLIEKNGTGNSSPGRSDM